MSDAGSALAVARSSMRYRRDRVSETEGSIGILKMHEAVLTSRPKRRSRFIACRSRSAATGDRCAPNDRITQSRTLILEIVFRSPELPASRLEVDGRP